MVEAPESVRCGLRDEHEEHPSCRSRLIVKAALTGLGIGMLCGTIPSPPIAMLVWNSTASAPIGLYRMVRADRFHVGDLVLARTPDQVRGLAAERHYVPFGVRLVKRVAAVGGDRVCARRYSITINGRLAARRAAVDPAGRVLPSWHGCRRLAAAEYLLLNKASASFDGRYFGPVGVRSIIGKAVPLWLR